MDLQNEMQYKMYMLNNWLRLCYRLSEFTTIKTTSESRNDLSCV